MASGKKRPRSEAAVRARRPKQPAPAPSAPATTARRPLGGSRCSGGSSSAWSSSRWSSGSSCRPAGPRRRTPRWSTPKHAARSERLRDRGRGVRPGARPGVRRLPVPVVQAVPRPLRRRRSNDLVRTEKIRFAYTLLPVPRRRVGAAPRPPRSARATRTSSSRTPTCCTRTRPRRTPGFLTTDQLVDVRRRRRDHRERVRHASRSACAANTLRRVRAPAGRERVEAGRELDPDAVHHRPEREDRGAAGEQTLEPGGLRAGGRPTPPDAEPGRRGRPRRRGLERRHRPLHRAAEPARSGPPARRGRVPRRRARAPGPEPRRVAACASTRSPAAASTPRTAGAARRRAVRRPRAFAGNTADYSDPRNSLLDDVIDRRLGIPITLSILMVEVGRRIGLALHGVGMPGHFLVGRRRRARRCSSTRSTRGRVLDVDGCREMFAALQGPDAPFSPAYLAPTGTRAILLRVLNNLQRSYLERSAVDAVWVARLRLRFAELPPPSGARPRRCSARSAGSPRPPRRSKSLAAGLDEPDGDDGRGRGPARCGPGRTERRGPTDAADVPARAPCCSRTGVLPLHVFEPRYRALVEALPRARTSRSSGSCSSSAAPRSGAATRASTSGPSRGSSRRAASPTGATRSLTVGTARLRGARVAARRPVPAGRRSRCSTSPTATPGRPGRRARRRSSSGCAASSRSTTRARGRGAAPRRQPRRRTRCAPRSRPCALAPIGPLDAQRLLEIDDPSRAARPARSPLLDDTAELLELRLAEG